MERSNPYADFGVTVTGTRFIGRQNELRAITSRIFGTGGFGSIAVVGLPRIGKTSLIFETIRRAEDLPIWPRSVVVRSNVGAADSVDSLFRSVIADLADDIHDRGLGSDPIEKRTTEALASSEVDFDKVRAVFRALRRADIRPICVLDEFDAGRRLFENRPQCFHWLRELCSNPEFKAAVVLVAKRRLQDVARLAGHESDYWANVLMTLPLKPLSDGDVGSFFLRLRDNGVSLSDGERTRVLTFCGGHPYLLDAFGYHAWDHVAQGGWIDIGWIETACENLFGEYFQQVSTVLGDGPMLSKAVQAIVGPQWDVTTEDINALCELGIVSQDEAGLLCGFSRTFEDHLRVAARGIDIWPLWRDTEQTLREFLEERLKHAFGTDWPNALVKVKPQHRNLIASCLEKQAQERKRFGDLAEPSLLAYTYPQDLYKLMCADWKSLGEPMFGRDRQSWAVKFGVLAKVRTPLAHNRQAVVSDGEREQAKGICQEILDRYYQLNM